MSLPKTTMLYNALLLLLAVALLSLTMHTNRSVQKYWVFFTDKAPTKFDLQHPGQFLSPAALERRERLDIPVRSTDLPVPDMYIDRIQSFGEVNVHHRSRWFNAVSVTARPEILHTIEQSSFVEKVRPVKHFRFKTRPFVTPVPSPPSPTRQQKVFDYGLAYNQIRMIKGDTLHQLGYSGQGMTIAVLDAGFINTDSMAVFDSLRQQNRLLGTYDFVDDDTSVFEVSRHGSFVLSTMASEWPGQIVGTAPDAQYWLLRTENIGYELIVEEDNWIAGAEFADSVGADVINSSLGYFDFQVDSTDHTYSDLDGQTTLISKGADMAASKGILVVNSAGNEGNSSWQHIIAPADGDSVLAVGAVDKDGKYASFSSLGPAADGRVKPNVAAQGQGTLLAAVQGGLARGSGTSFSSPIVAGMAACLWQAFPNKTNMLIMAAIQQSAHQYETPDERLGFGIPNFAKAYQLLAQNKKDTGTIAKPLLFPNPFQETVYLFWKVEEPINMECSLYNSAGQRVAHNRKGFRSGFFYRFNIMEFLLQQNLRNLASGMYLLVLRAENHGPYVYKLIKS